MSSESITVAPLSNNKIPLQRSPPRGLPPAFRTSLPERDSGGASVPNEPPGRGRGLGFDFGFDPPGFASGDCGRAELRTAAETHTIPP